MDSQPEPLSKILIHKEKKQKKNNKTTGQIDNLEKYTTPGDLSTGQSAKVSQSDKLISREANYMKNLRIDELYDRLVQNELIMDHKYKAFWCGAIHRLGCAFVEAQAEHALQHGKSPAALFHFLINKQLNKSNDPYSPRFNARR